MPIRPCCALEGGAVAEGLTFTVSCAPFALGCLMHLRLLSGSSLASSSVREGTLPSLAEVLQGGKLRVNVDVAMLSSLFLVYAWRHARHCELVIIGLRVALRLPVSRVMPELLIEVLFGGVTADRVAFSRLEESADRP